MTRVEIADALPRAAEIVADVRDRGDAALLDWSEQLDGERPASLRVPEPEIAACRSRRGVPRRRCGAWPMRSRGCTSAASARQSGSRRSRVSRSSGRFVPLRSVGIYAPGGRGRLSVVARDGGDSGAGRRCRAHRGRLAPAVRRPSWQRRASSGSTRSTPSAVRKRLPRSPTEPRRSRAVDKIVGPGNRWVTAAKLLVSGRVGIDLPAGPSEVLIVADETADAALCAADLLAQAEHGPDSECVLVTTSGEAGRGGRRARPAGGSRCASRWSRRSTTRSRAQTTTPRSISSSHVADPEAAAGRVVNAGSVFIGPSAPAVLGDYAAGANHVLPTGGLARAAGGLGLEAFLKPIQYVTATRDGLAAVRETMAAFARIEGLPLHAAAVEARFATVTG